MSPITFNGEDLLVLDLEPVWSSGIRAEFSALVATEIGLTNRETRRSLGSTIRVTLSYTMLASGADAMRVTRALRDLQTTRVAVPFWPGACLWSQRSARPFTSGLSFVRGVDAGSFEVFSDAEPTWPAAHDEVMPLLVGYLRPKEPEWLTPTTALLAIEFTEASAANRSLVANGGDLLPGPRPSTGWASVPVVFPAVQHFDRPASGARVEIEREEIGFGREPVETLYPQLNHRQGEVSCVMTPGELPAFLRFFAEHAGGRAFWIAGPNVVAELAAEAFDVDTELSVATGHPVKTGDFLAIQGENRAAFVQATDAQASALVLDAPAGSFVPGKTSIHELLLARLERPRLILEWRSPQLGVARVGLRELPAEYSPAADEVLGETLGVVPTKAFLYEIEMATDTGTEVFRHTSFDQDLELNLISYPSGPIEHRSLTRGIALDRDELELRFAPRPGDLTHPFVRLATLRAEAPVRVTVREAQLLVIPDAMTNYTLLLNESAAVDGAPVLTQDKRRFICYLVASNVTVGATIHVEARMPDNAWASIHVEGFTATGTKVLSWEGVFAAIRARVLGYTDGTYTAYLVTSA